MKVLWFLVTVCMCVGIGGADKGVCESESCRDPKTTERVKSTKELWEMVMKRLERVKASCGELCDLTKTGEPGKYFDFIQKDVNCRYKMLNCCFESIASKKIHFQGSV